MKKILNILGYISIITIPVIALVILIVFLLPVQICSVIVFFSIMLINIYHIIKTKVRYFGIRILVSILCFCIIVFTCQNVYGLVKNKHAVEMLGSMDRIEFNRSYSSTYDREYNIVIKKEDLVNSDIQFINERTYGVKGGLIDGIVYYKDGTSKSISRGTFFSSLFLIDGEWYVINLPQ